MTTKITLTDLASLTNEQSAIASINANYDEIETKSDTFLSRVGTAPNAMGADLDMNSNQILNLPTPVADTDVVRLVDMTAAIAASGGGGGGGSGGGGPAAAGTLTGATLAPNVIVSSLTSVGTITSGTWNGTAIDLASGVSGNLAMSHINSGTGASSSTFLRGDGTWVLPSAGSTDASALTGTTLATNVVTSSLTSVGTIATGVWSGTAINLATKVSGNLAVTNLGSGTNANSTTFWRGDGSWQVPISTLPTLADGTLWIGNASNAATAVTLTGDVTTTRAGVTSIGSTKVTNAMLAGSIAASKFVGSDIGTVGTITSGTWSADPIAVTKGGTALTSVAQGDILYASASNTITALTKDTTATRYLSNRGTSNNPTWTAINLADGVSGNLSVNNLNSGTSASSTTFWRGDGAWASLANLTATTITSSSANALAVGANGITNPVLQVDDSTASVVTGIKITGAASGAGIAIAAISSATNEALSINAKGSGQTTIATTSTGSVTIGTASTVVLTLSPQQTRITGTSAPALTFGNDNLSGFGNRDHSTSFDFSAWANNAEIMRWTPTVITAFSSLLAASTLASSVTRTITSASLEAGSAGWADVEVVGSTTTISGSTNVASFPIAKTLFDAPVLTASTSAIAIAQSSTVYIAGPPTASSSGGFTPVLTEANALNVASGRSVFRGPTFVIPTRTLATANPLSWSDFEVTSTTTTLTGTTTVPSMARVNIGIGTLTNASANTVSLATTLLVTGPPTAAGSVTITNNFAALFLAGNVSHATSSYINFGTTSGTGGYGFFDSGGTLQFKNSGGSWANLSAPLSTVLFVDTVSCSSANAILYHSIFKGSTSATEASVAKMYLPRAGTLKNLRAACYLVAQGATAGDIFVRVNGSDTALTVNIPANTTTGTVVSDLTHTVTVSLGDYVVVKMAQNTNNSGIFSVSFEYA